MIGRRIEETLLVYLSQVAKKAGAVQLIGEFISTGKNNPAKGFYSKNSFVFRETIDDKEMWEYDVEHNEHSFLDFIDAILPEHDV